MGDYRSNYTPFHAYGDAPRNGPYSSFPSNDYERPYNNQNWKEPPGPFGNNPYDGQQFGGPPAGSYEGQPFGGPPPGAFGGPPYGGGPPSNQFDGPAYGGGPPGGPGFGGPFGDAYNGQRMGWNGGPEPRQGSFGEDTWRSQSNDTWRGNRPNWYEEPRTDESYRRRSRSPSRHPGRSFPRKSESYNHEDRSRPSHSLRERSRHSADKEIIERHRSSPRTIARPESKEGTKSEIKKSEHKKEETKGKAEMNECRFDEPKENGENGGKDDGNDSSQLETSNVQQKSDESQEPDIIVDSSSKGDDKGKELRIRSDLTHDDIHHYKTITMQDDGEHQKSADAANQKESFRKYLETTVKQKSMNSPDKTTERNLRSPVVADGSSPQRIRSPVLDPQKYVEELSNPDLDPPKLDELANDLLPKKIMPASNEFLGHKKPLISERPPPSWNTEPPPVSSDGRDSFGGFFSGPVIAGPTKMYVKRRTLVSSPPPVVERPYRPGLLDAPPSKRPYEETYYMQPPSPQRPVKPGLLDAPPMGAPKLQERPRNGPAINPAISAVAESITAVATALAPPEVIATVTEKGIAEEILCNESLKSKIKEVYAEEIRKILTKKAGEQQRHAKESEKPWFRGGEYRDEGFRNSPPRLSFATGLGRDDYDDFSHSREQRGDAEVSSQFFKYSGPDWRTKNEDRNRWGADPHKLMKMLDAYRTDDGSQYYDGPPHRDYDMSEEECYARRSGANRPTYEEERYGPPPDHFVARSREQYDGPPSERYNGPPDVYSAHSDRYNGPAPDRYNGPPDRYFGPPSSYPGRNEPGPSSSYHGYNEERNYGGSRQGRY